MPAARRILASGEHLEITSLDYRVGDGTEPHLHDHEQVGWVASGRFRLSIEGRMSLHEAGSGYVVPAHAVHTFEVLEPGVVYIVTSPRQLTRKVLA